MDAIGLIKHVSRLKKIPTGKIRVLSPVGIRGLETTFFVSDVEIPQDDRKYLEAGMQLQFRIRGDSINGFTAHNVKPVDCAEYNGSVIRVPSATDHTKKVIVSLDLTLTPVSISHHSLRRLRLAQPLAPRDYVRVSIRWTEWIKAQRGRVKPDFDIVQVLEVTKHRPRALSQGRDSRDVDSGRRLIRASDEVSSEELSPQHERLNRQREIAQRGQRQRSRSVGCLAALSNELLSLPFHHHVPPRRHHNPYPIPSHNMMYDIQSNFQNRTAAWMPHGITLPFVPRGPR